MRTIRILAVTVAAIALVAGSGLPASATPDPTYPTGTFTVLDQGPLQLSGYPAIFDDPIAVTMIYVNSLSDDNTPSNRIRLNLTVTGGSRGWGASYIRPGGVPDGETKGIVNWEVDFNTPGTYTPTVTLADQDDHETTVTLPTITVIDDPTPAVVAVRPPAALHSVAAWSRIRGTATDPESSVVEVDVTVLERRAGVWYAYDARRKVWHRGTRSESWTSVHRGLPTGLQVPANGRWTTPRLARLRQGLLVLHASATHDGSNAVGHAPPVRVMLTRR